MKGLLVKLLVLLLIIAIIISASLRFSEQHGPMAKKGCIYAIIITLIAAVMGIIPFLASNKKSAAKLFISLAIGAVIRITATALGVVLIIIITAKEQRFWFLAFTAFYYLLFLCIETTEAVCCVKKLEFENDNESGKNGLDTVWYESS